MGGLKRRLRICVLGSARSPHVNMRAQAFIDRGHAVTVISPRPPSEEERGRFGFDVLYPSPAEMSGLLGKVRLLVWTAAALLRTRADIYHAHYAAEVGSWLAWLLWRRPLAVTVMGGDVLFSEQGTLGRLGRWLTRRTVAGANYVTVKSPFLARVVAGFGVAADRIETVVWGIDTAVFHDLGGDRAAMRTSWNVGAGRPLVFSPRMLQPFYNIDLIVEAWPDVLAAHPDAVLAVSRFRADPDYESTIRRRIGALGIEDAVVFVPSMARDEMAAAYVAADVVVSLAPSDGLPQAVLEAMACSRPVVLTDLERFHELFEPDVDVLYTPLRRADLARAITAILTAPDHAARRAERARAKVLRLAEFKENVDRVESRFLALTGAA